MTDMLERHNQIAMIYGHTNRRLIDRIIELEDEVTAARQELWEKEQGREATQPCHFPEHRHYKYGNVTHMRMIPGSMVSDEDGMHYLETCVVCNAVYSRQAIALA